jgi:hypothetical protein
MRKRTERAGGGTLDALAFLDIVLDFAFYTDFPHDYFWWLAGPLKAASPFRGDCAFERCCYTEGTKGKT